MLIYPLAIWLVAALFGAAEHPTNAQNVTMTTTITTEAPISTVSTVVSGTVTRRVPPSTIYATTTIESLVVTTTAVVDPASAVALDTKLDAPFGVLGAMLIITGLPSAFWGHKNRWSSFFLIGFYSFALACLALILRFGVLEAVNPPTQTIRGLFVLSCIIAGFVGGGVSIFFWKQTKYAIGGFGGLATGFLVQSLRHGGVIRQLGFRWILYIGLTVIGFVLCTIPRIHYQVLLASTAIVGATVFILGVDCFTTAGLKEFYVYNLGFRRLFPKYHYVDFPVSQTMQVELGMLFAVAVIGMAVQARILVVLRARLREITAEQEKRNAELEAIDAARFEHLTGDLDQWEREHGKKALQGKGTDLEATPPLGGHSTRFSFLGGKFHNSQSFATTLGEPATPNSKGGEDPLQHSLAVDLGSSVKAAIPSNLVLPDPKDADLENQKGGLLDEIESIKRSIEALKGSSDGRSPTDSFSTRGARLSTLSTDMVPDHLRPPRAAQPHERRRSLDMLSTITPTIPEAIQRPRSSPLREDEWNGYIQSRKLFQPPSGVTEPIPTSPVGPIPQRRHSINLSDALVDAIDQRRKREREFEEEGPAAFIDSAVRSSSRPQVTRMESTIPTRGEGSSRDMVASGGSRPTSRLLTSQERPQSQGLPRPTPLPIQAPTRSPVETRSPEEIAARHKEKIRALQAPLTEKEREEAEVAAAKARWRRSQTVEKEFMTRRDAQHQSSSDNEKRRSTQRRSSSVELMAPPGARRPGSVAKVQDWRAFQSRHAEQGAGQSVPFPATSSRRPTNQSTGRNNTGMN